MLEYIVSAKPVNMVWCQLKVIELIKAGITLNHTDLPFLAQTQSQKHVHMINFFLYVNIIHIIIKLTSYI